MASPIIKWVGGKRQLMDAIISRLPEPWRTPHPDRMYFEPFIGGGAVFFALHERGLVSEAVLNDYNPELANLYRVVQSRPKELARQLAQPFFANTQEAFSAVRAWDRDAMSFRDKDPVLRAARFLYLNRTAFNGLWRVNAKGQFNVPFGRYKNPTLPSEETLLAASRALAVARILEGDFEVAVADAEAGDFVYFDPPYVPLSASAAFTSYTDQGFDGQMQERLARLCGALTQKGVYWMLSNSDTPYCRELFGTLDTATLHLVSARRAINSKGDGRGKVGEILVTNQPHDA